MKKLLSLALVFVALAGIVSCGGDEAKPLNIQIDGENVEGILNAYVIDEGTTCIDCKTDGVNDARRITFVLTDGEFIFGTDGFIDTFENGDMDMWIELRTYSLGDSFEPGEFDIWDWWCDNTTTGGAWFDTYWYDGEGDIYYYGYEGTVKITQNGSTYGFTFDGEMYDYQDPTVTRTEGACSGGYNLVDVTGGFKAKFIEISEEAWNDWD